MSQGLTPFDIWSYRHSVRILTRIKGGEPLVGSRPWTSGTPCERCYRRKRLIWKTCDTMPQNSKAVRRLFLSRSSPGRDAWLKSALNPEPKLISRLMSRALNAPCSTG